MAEVEFEDRDYAEAVARGAAERAGQPTPRSVRYEPLSDRIVVEFENGAAFMVPARLLQGLESADPDDIAKVELAGETGLHWPQLDLDFTISGLMQGVFGTEKFMAASRRGGQSRSVAKAEAARRNGRLGGRPRKSS
ncbi:DUF2442 domain-containing protein [Devosia sp. YIM 151766]|uniref:DUF2442 domain-containing protein n=1 Tax=Devosia sp. YIM 151766 TaxID=3017325 RepID=UPI00255CDB73|nr:DUF2442 domain-containing protein [Devosia sp. YIM 151766]WIY53723.1 DUF2442 domain-containing protein [Devosia sp. YIM 151766]